MVRLSQLVERLGGRCEPAGATAVDPVVTDVHLDSRRIGLGHLFAALPGTVPGAANGADYAPRALAAGAVAVLSPERLAPLLEERADWSNWVHPEARRVAGEAAAWVHGHPSRNLALVGITGTNGKSTVAHLVGQLLRHAGRRPGVLGTVEVRLWGSEPRPATHTTPDATELQRLCRANVDAGGDTLVLEVSSHALDQQRISGLELDVAVFTNLSPDHLDYHSDMESYLAAKARIFSALREGGTAVVNADDARAQDMIRAAHAAGVGARVVTYGIGSRCDLSASRLNEGTKGTHLFLEGMGIPWTGLFLPLVGRHNVENALAALAATLALGTSPSCAIEGLVTTSAPKGRMQPVDVGEHAFRVFVDYAHTPDALNRVLATLRNAQGEDGGRLICIFGCGGDRDRTKRGVMGRVVGVRADVAVLTSDNPRNEDPAAIIADVLEGMDSASAEVVVEADRRTAIRRGLAMARAGDIVLIAGKGHEAWQLSSGQRLPFDDVRVVGEELP